MRTAEIITNTTQNILTQAVVPIPSLRSASTVFTAPKVRKKNTGDTPIHSYLTRVHITPQNTQVPNISFSTKSFH